MECRNCKPYVPVFDSPYPEQLPLSISEFTYDTPLHLCRYIRCLQLGDGSGANFGRRRLIQSSTRRLLPQTS